MRIYAVSCPTDERYDYIQQIAFNPDVLDWFRQGYIVWYKDLEDNQSLDMYLGDIREFFTDKWKIWECNCRIFDCCYKNHKISQLSIYGNGVIELEYKEGEFQELKYWKTKDDYYHGKPFIEEITDPFK